VHYPNNLEQPGTKSVPGRESSLEEKNCPVHYIDRKRKKENSLRRCTKIDKAREGIAPTLCWFRKHNLMSRTKKGERRKFTREGKNWLTGNIIRKELKTLFSGLRLEKKSSMYQLRKKRRKKK